MNAEPSSAGAPEAAARLGAALERLPGGAARDEARELVAAVLDLHRAALARALELAASRGGATVEALAEDELVGKVLALHGLHPVPLEARVRAAIDRLGPRLGREGASIALVALGPDALSLRLTRPPGAADLGRMIEDALDETAPDAPPPAIEVVTAPPQALIPAERLIGRLREAGAPETTPERCEICGAAIADGHPHLVDPAASKLVCACPACLLGASGRLRPVVPRAIRLDGFRLDDARWGALGIPVEMAFFVRSSAADRVLGLYPGPAGVTESRLSLDAFGAILADNPGFDPLEPDVEALLVNRLRGARAHYRVSIDVAYALVGLLRERWRGLSGGADAHRAVADFLATLGSPEARSACPA